MNRVALLTLLGSLPTWAGILTFADNCVQTNTTFQSCNVAMEGNNSSTPVSLAGMFGTASASDTINLTGGGGYGSLHGYASGSLSISGSPALAYSYGGSAFQDTLTISNPNLTGQTGYLQIGYILDAVISSTGIDDGSVIAIADVGGVGNPGTVYSDAAYTSSVTGSFVFPQLFSFTYGTPFSFGIGMYAAVGTGTWVVDPSAPFGYDYGFSLATGTGSATADASDTLTLSLLEVENSSGAPVGGATFTSGSGTIYGPEGIVPEPSTGFLLFSALTLLFWCRFKTGCLPSSSRN